VDLDIFVIKESGPSESQGLDNGCGIGRELCDGEVKL